MRSDLLVLLLLVVVVLIGSALCSGVEAALLTVNPIRVHELAARSRPLAGARRLAPASPTQQQQVAAATTSSFYNKK